MHRLILMVSLLMAGAGMLLAGALPAAAVAALTVTPAVASQSDTAGVPIGPIAVTAADGAVMTPALVVHWTISGQPAGVTISAAGIITGTPGAAGTFPATVTATEVSGGANAGAAGSATVTFNVTAGTATATATPTATGTATATATPTATGTATATATPTMTSLVSSASPSMVGVSVTFTATVKGVPPRVPAPAGPVVFYKNGVPEAAVALTPVAAGSTDSTARTVISFPAVGSYVIKAFYAGSVAGRYGPSQASVTQTVQLTVATPSGTPTATPAVTPAVTPAATTPAAVVPGAAPPAGVLPMGAVGTGGGGSLGDGVNAALATAGSLAVLAGAGLGGLAIRRRRRRNSADR